MITREQIPQVVGHPVHDAEGRKVGDAKHMYLDDTSGNPEWVTVKTGFFGSNETFVPIRSARLVQDHLEVPYPKEKIKAAPNVDVDTGGHLSVEEEQHLYHYYGIERSDGSEGKGMSPERTGGAAGGAGDAAGGGTAETAAPDADMGTGMGAGSGTDAGTGAYAPAPTGSAEPAGAGGAQAEAEPEAMMRSEEEMHIKVERRASGKARLHKYVEVEEVEETVPLRHEEVTLEREPLSAADREAMRPEAQIAEAERFVTLHEESPVVETEVVAKERVRMHVQEQVEQKKVHGRVRKERIEADMEGPGQAAPGGEAPR